MAESLFCLGMKGASKEYRENWDRIFGKRGDKSPWFGCVVEGKESTRVKGAAIEKFRMYGSDEMVDPETKYP